MQITRRLKRAGETTEAMYVDSEDLCDYICYECASKKQRATLPPLLEWDEVDTPAHCMHCGALCVTSLTTYGAAYVNKKVKEADGDPVILKLWAEEFSWAIKAEVDEDGNEEVD